MNRQQRIRSDLINTQLQLGAKAPGGKGKTVETVFPQDGCGLGLDNAKKTVETVEDKNPGITTQLKLGVNEKDSPRRRREAESLVILGVARVEKVKKIIHALLVGLLLTSCSKEASSPITSARQSYPAKGVVKELDPDGKTVVIQHQAISNYMAAMTMPFEVRDTNELRGLKPGDAVDFQLIVTKTEGWIEHLHKTGEASPPTTTPKANASAVQVSKALEPLDEGDMLPDYHFTNELGQPVHLSQYKGGALAFTFFFTSCPFPNFCPRMTSNFEEASLELEKMKNAPAHWQLLSISFDPKTDSPEHLLNYAKNANYDPAHWSFLTGAPDQISSLADQFGENFWTENGTISHNLRTVVVDPSGRIKKIFVGNTWTPGELVAAMVK